MAGDLLAHSFLARLGSSLISLRACQADHFRELLQRLPGHRLGHRIARVLVSADLADMQSALFAPLLQRQEADLRVLHLSWPALLRDV
eukprot:4477740-Pyramimonas_sp.AAC.1